MEELTNASPELDLRHRLFALGRRLFVKPYLPNALIFLTLLIILTDTTFVLIQQPSIYWTDYTQASVSIAWLEQLLTTSPWLFAAAILVYLVIIGLVLYLLTRPLTIAIWMIVCYFHLRSLILWSGCGLNSIYRFNDITVCNAFSLVLSILLAGLLGLVFARTLFTNDQTADKITKPRFLRLSSGLTIAWLFFLAVGLVRAVGAPSPGWSPIQTENQPLARVHGVIAYDTVREAAVLFGGASAWLGNDWLYLSDTWEWDGTNWQQHFPQTTPAGRVELSIAFDETREVTVLFGGRSQDGLLQDTWEWDGQQWQARFPVNSPPARCCHELFYDSQRGKIVLYGGYDQQTFFNDAWEWDGENWQAISFETISPTTSSSPMAYDKDLDRAVAFQYEGTWVWRAQSWSRLELDLEPPIRGTTELVYDPGQKHMVLFGGAQDSESFFNDTWFLDEEVWQEFESTRSPTARWGHATFYDAARQRVIIFGGYDGINYNNDLWELVIPD